MSCPDASPRSRVVSASHAPEQSAKSSSSPSALGALLAADGAASYHPKEGKQGYGTVQRVAIPGTAQQCCNIHAGRLPMTTNAWHCTEHRPPHRMNIVDILSGMLCDPCMVGSMDDSFQGFIRALRDG